MRQFYFEFSASYLKVCHRSDPRLNDCIKQSVNSLKPYLKNGIPALHVPPCEPFHIKEIEINQASGPISMHAKYSNVSIFGGTSIVPKSIRYVFQLLYLIQILLE